MAMSKKNNKTADESDHHISKKAYNDILYKLQIELVKLQRHLIRKGDKILIIFEGRDAAGKDGTIKRIIRYLSPREIRVVALGKPWTGIAARGIFSVMYPTCPQRRNWCYLTAAGTTGLGSSVSWVSARTPNMMNS